MNITFLLNGETVALRDVDPTRSVLEWLREERGLKGTKEGCNEGDCGACSVMVSDAEGTRALNACILMLGQMEGKALTSVEGLSGPDGGAHPVQSALITHHGSQCGFCTPGIAISLAAAHLDGATNFDDRLAGNLCRCTGYAPIIRAADAARSAAVPDWFSPSKHGHGAARERAARAAVTPALPGSADALATCLMENPHATLIAGATDVSLWLTKGLKELNNVIFLGGVHELAETYTDENGLYLGANLTIETLRHTLLDPFPHFAEMLRRFASAQVRNTATLGGNIANGSPIGDTPPPLIALGAQLHLRRGEVKRHILLEDFFIEYGRQDLQVGEFVEGITIPIQTDNLKTYKISKRFDQDISTVLAAFNIVRKDGIVQSARIAFGGMAATPKRARTIEAALTDRPWNRVTIDAALPAFINDFAPLSDMRASASYRLEVAQNMLLRCWLEDQGERACVREVQP